MWVARPVAEGQCTLTIFAKVHFVKGCLMGWIVRAATIRETTKFFGGLVQQAAGAASPGVGAAGGAGGAAGGNEGGGRARASIGGLSLTGQGMGAAVELRVQVSTLLAFLVVVAMAGAMSSYTAALPSSW